MAVNQHGRNSSRFYTCVIGDRRYRTVKIGNRVWTAENLEYVWAGLDVSTPGNPITGLPTDPTAWYYNDDESTYGLDGTKPCGMLYNGYARQYIVDHAADLLPPGWRVPNAADWSYLRNDVSVNTDGNTLKVLDGTFGGVWPSGWNGTDIVKFGLVPAGQHSSSGFNGLDSSTNFWLDYLYNGSHTYGYIASNGTMSIYSSTDEGTGKSIRLVRDA